MSNLISLTVLFLCLMFPFNAFGQIGCFGEELDFDSQRNMDGFNKTLENYAAENISRWKDTDVYSVQDEVLKQVNKYIEAGYEMGYFKKVSGEVYLNKSAFAETGAEIILRVWAKGKTDDQFCLIRVVVKEMVWP